MGSVKFIIADLTCLLISIASLVFIVYIYYCEVKEQE